MAPRFSIGIDLGTTNSVLAYAPLDDAAAPSAVLSVRQWGSPAALVEQATLPSFLYLPEDEVRLQMRGGAIAPGEWVVGQFAKSRAQEAPGRVAHSAKSWLCHHGTDREAAFLPWGSRDLAVAEKISPVRAAALILNYLRGVWNDRFAGQDVGASFDAQDVTITVPASFDAAAQRLTLMAAEAAGYPQTVRLLEEPQAAFYTWLEQHGGEGGAWEALGAVLGPEAGEGALRHVLVVDIGGGTSDFSLFAVQREDGGAGAGGVRRVAVSEHILLGGDNIDLALAHTLEARLAGDEGRLDGAAWDFLVARCRELKEQALAGEGAGSESYQIAIPGRGSGLFAGTRTAAIGRGEIDRIVVDGFFPECSADAAPKRIAAALQEWGLPYAADSAITRHLAHFLKGRPPPDAVLFNGGALYPPALRRRLCEQIGRWQNRAEVPALANDAPDLAVARGAARFGRLLHSGSGRIAADAARAIFLEVQARSESAAAPALVCVLPQGAVAEEAVSIGDLALELRINRPVRFQAYASSRHEDARPGEVIEAGADDLRPLPPLETIARVDRPPPGQRSVAVTLDARMSELGLLELACRSADPGLRATWPLAFNLRAGGGGTTGAAVAAEANAPADAVAEAAERIAAVFSKEPRGRDKLSAARVLAALEKILGCGKGDWNWVLVRSLWPSLAASAEGRGRSPEHEETWLILAGFLLRPGFGAAADEARMDQLWEIQAEGFRCPGKRLKLQQHILWRRVAGGLSRARQEAVLAQEGPQIRRQKTLSPELVRMTGAFERLPLEIKAELAERYIATAAELARAGKHAAPYLAALGMLLNRAPLYAGPEDVVPPELVEQAYEAFAKLDWADPELVELQTLFLRAARVTGSRALDVRATVRNRIAGKLEKLGMAAARTARLKALMPITPAERLGLVGEALPPGLILGEG
ncbi:MAG: Hsp70 family protein [Rhodospirillales bacterium]|nr:Hsp70 family protein [Rhodospirillales bacterium]